MPWRQVAALSRRLRFVGDVRQRLVWLTEWCAIYGTSRTRYKWLARAIGRGLDFCQSGLAGRIRALVLCYQGCIRGCSTPVCMTPPRARGARTDNTLRP